MAQQEVHDDLEHRVQGGGRVLVPLDELADVQSLEELEAAPHALAGLLLVQPAQDPGQLLKDGPRGLEGEEAQDRESES